MNQQPQRAAAQQAVAGPAISLMVVAGICIALLMISIPFDIFLLVTGLAAKLDRGGIDPTLKVVVRTIWAFVLLAASGYVFWGALQMKQLTNYSLAKTAAIVACVPCLGPCCLLGIPFGAWALNVLGRPEVMKSFEN
jgi:hypothetical protein